MDYIDKCCICGGEIQKIYEIKFKDLIGIEESDYIENIGYCSRCGFLFNANPFNEKQLENRYKNFSKYEFNDNNKNFIESKDFIKRSNIQKKFIEENCDKKIESIFEIGAATAYNLNLYKQEGKKVFGIEPSKKNKEIALEKYGINLYSDTLQNYLKDETIEHSKFDLIFLSGFLEHIVNPMQCIQNLASFSNKYIFIDVPTFDFKFSDEVYGMFSDEHVNYFTFESIQNIMSKANYHLVNARIEFYLDCYVPAGTPGLLSIWEKNEDGKEYNSRKIINNSLEIFNNYIKDSEKLIKKIEEKLEKIDDKERLAIWGAGNHTSRLLAMTSLSKKNIVKIYDSDIKKQGHKLLGKEICQFNINDFEKDNVEKILISSYASQNVILKSMEKEDIIKKIITLY